jgi:predicted NBD/HSP70 family sugar kinase
MLAGIDIGGTKTIITVADRKTKEVASERFPTPQDPIVALDIFSHIARRLAGTAKLTAVGVAAPGPLDTQKGLILDPPTLKWRNTKIVAGLQERLDVPVALEHDTNAAAIAEYTEGSGKGSQAMLYVTISTGIGTGLIVGGKVYRGAHDTEGGHITIRPGGRQCGCGGHGHFESEVSGRAIKERFGRYGYEIKDKATWDAIAHDLALGLANLNAVLSPDRIVLGGGVSVHWTHFKKPLQKYFKEYVTVYSPPKITLAKNIETAAVRGALLLAQNAHARQ